MVRGLDSDIPIQLQLRISLQCLFAPLIIIAVCVFLGVVIISLLCFCMKKNRVPVGMNGVVHDNFNRNAKTRKIHYHERPAFDQIPVIENTPTIGSLKKLNKRLKLQFFKKIQKTSLFRIYQSPHKIVNHISSNQ